MVRSFDGSTNLVNPLIKPTGLNLTMNLETLLRLRNDPGYLHTFDTIPDHLRDSILKSAASITVMLVDNCGTLLDLGKTARFPNAKLSKYLEQRDVTCRFPGCNNNARRADLDHQQPWKISPGETGTSSTSAGCQSVRTVSKGPASERGEERCSRCASASECNLAEDGHTAGSLTADSHAAGSHTAARHTADSHAAGNQTAASHKAGTRTSGIKTSSNHNPSDHSDGETCGSNMAALCRTHHLMKHHTDWQVQHEPDHSLTWITPNGHRHRTEPWDWRLTLPAKQIDEARLQLAAREAAEEQEAARIQAELDAKYPDIPPF